MVAVTLMWSTAGVVTRHLEFARSFEVTFWRALFTALTLLLRKKAAGPKPAAFTVPFRVSAYTWLNRAFIQSTIRSAVSVPVVFSRCASRYQGPA